jgi:hypothetical protein
MLKISFIIPFLSSRAYHQSEAQTLSCCFPRIIRQNPSNLGKTISSSKVSFSQHLFLVRIFAQIHRSFSLSEKLNPALIGIPFI